MPTQLPNTVSGAVETNDLLGARRIVDMSDMIVQLEETDRAPFTTFLDSLGVRPVYNHSFNWLTDGRIRKTHTTGAIIAGGVIPQWNAGVPIVIDLAGLSTNVYVRENDLLRSPDTGEIFKVVATPATMAAVSVLRNVGGIAAALPAIPAGAQITRISNVVPENSVLRTGAGPDTLNSLTTEVTDNFNFTQTFRDPVGMSRREMDAKLYGGPDRPYQRAKKLIDHAEQIENALWHSVRSVSATSAGGNDTVMGGMIDAIENLVDTPGSNTFAVGGSLSENDFNAFMRVFSRYGNSSRKKFFSSRFVCELVANFLRDGGTTYRLSGEIAKGGRTAGSGEVTAYASGVGFTADLVPTRALEGIPGSRVGLTVGPAAGAWDGIGVLVDPENVKLTKYGDCYMQLEVDLQLPDQDGVVDSYKSDVGLQWGNPEHHALMTGIDS